MKKIVLTIILLTPFLVDAKSNCTSWWKKDFKTGVVHSNDQLIINDCTCPCNSTRTSSNICLECGHGHLPETLDKKSKNIIQEIEDTFEDAYEYAVDLITTHTGTK